MSRIDQTGRFLKASGDEMRRNWIKTLTVWSVIFLMAGCALLRTRRLENKKDTVSVLTYDLQTTINRPVKEVFELTRLWNTYVVGYASYSEVSGPGLTGIGNFNRGEASLAGRKVKWTETVAEWEEQRTVRFVYSGDMRGSVRISMEPLGDKTRYRFSAHIFFLPDSALASALNAFLEQGILGDYLDQTVTDWLVKDFAKLENKEPEQVRLDQKPVHSVFADAYLTATETFSISPEKLFQILNSRDGLKAILPLDRIEPAEKSPPDFEGLGNHYRATASRGLTTPLVYDLVIVQYDPPKEARYYLYAGGAAMEIDLIVVPDATGSKALILFILDLPESVAGRTLDVLIHLSDIDQQAQKELTELKSDQLR